MSTVAVAHELPAGVGGRFEGSVTHAFEDDLHDEKRGDDT